MVWYRGLESDRALEEIQERLHTQFPGHLLFVEPPQSKRPGTPRQRLMIIRKDSHLDDLLDWKVWFPHPWNVDKRVEDWLV